MQVNFEEERFLGVDQASPTTYIIAGVGYVNSLSEQDKIQQEDGVVAIEVEHSQFGVFVRRARHATHKEMEEFARGIDPTLEHIENQATQNGNVIRTFHPQQTWQQANDRARRIAKIALPRMESKIMETASSGEALMRVVLTINHRRLR